MSAPSRASIPSPMRRVSRARNSERGSDFFEDDSAEAMFGDKLPSGKLKRRPAYHAFCLPPARSHWPLMGTCAGIWSPKSRVGSAPLVRDSVLPSNISLPSPFSQPSLLSGSRPASALGSIGPAGSPLASPLPDSPVSPARRNPWRPPYLDEDDGMVTVEWKEGLHDSATDGDSDTYNTPDTRPSTAARRRFEWKEPVPSPLKSRLDRSPIRGVRMPTSPQPDPLSAFGGSSVGLLRGGSPFSALSVAASFAQLGSPMVRKPRPGSRPVKQWKILHI